MASTGTTKSLDFTSLMHVNIERCEKSFHSIDSWSIEKWMLALFGEAGEACNATKKLIRFYDGTNTDKDPQTEHDCIAAIGKELADIVIYADLCASRLGLKLGDEVIKKFNEVSLLKKSSITLP